MALLGIPLLSASAAMGQTYFSFSAGSDGFGFNVTNMPVYPAVPVPAVVRVPLLPGYDCGYDPGHSYHKYNKKQRKAYKKIPKGCGACGRCMGGHVYAICVWCACRGILP